LYPDINISYSNEDAFRNACYYGHLEVAKWLLQVKPDINNSFNNEMAFRCACVKGHLEVAKWLLQVKLDINNSYQSAFHLACEYGHLEVAQWLLSMKPDINMSVYNHYAFRTACVHGSLVRELEVAEWLQSLKPYLYVIEYDIDGKYIIGYKVRSKEEANWENRKYALHLTLQEETNIMYHLPIDIAKSVTIFV
jgi:ankyrin repeat protein